MQPLTIVVPMIIIIFIWRAQPNAKRRTWTSEYFTLNTLVENVDIPLLSRAQRFYLCTSPMYIWYIWRDRNISIFIKQVFFTFEDAFYMDKVENKLGQEGATLISPAILKYVRSFGAWKGFVLTSQELLHCNTKILDLSLCGVDVQFAVLLLGFPPLCSSDALRCKGTLSAFIQGCRNEKVKVE